MKHLGNMVVTVATRRESASSALAYADRSAEPGLELNPKTAAKWHKRETGDHRNVDTRSAFPVEERNFRAI